MLRERIANMTVGNRLTLFTLLIVVAVMALSGFARIDTAAEQLSGSMAEHFSLTADLAVESLTEPLWTYNDATIKAIGDAFFTDRNIDRVVIMGTNDAVLYDRQIRSPEYDPGKLVPVERTIEKNGLAIGRIVIDFTSYYSERELRNVVINIFASILVTCAVLWLGIAFVARSVTRPLYALGKGTDEIATGRFDLRLDATSKDEIGQLAGKFNFMAENVQRMMAERQEQYAELLRVSDSLKQSEERFRTVVTNTPIVIYSLDNEGVFTLSEGLGLGLLGLRAGEVVGRSAFEVYGDYPDILQAVQNTLAGQPVFFEHKVGDSWFDNRMVPVFAESGRVIGLIGTALDITARKLAADSLERSEAKLQASLQEVTAAHEELIASEEELRANYTELAKEQQRRTAMYSLLPDRISLLGKDGTFLDYNEPPGFPLVFSNENIRGKNLADYLPPELAGQELARFREVVETGRPLTHEIVVESGGNRFSLEIRIVKVSDEQVMTLIRDFTERKKMQDNLEYLTLHDALTGAFNRARFETDMVRIRESGYTSLGMFICDVDGLKMINDTLGHHHGDTLLKNVAAILAAEVREPDYVARIGGDEFAVILFDPTKHAMENLNRRYQNKVDEYNRNTPHLPLSLSLGWAIGEGCPDADTVFKSADNNMYRQKMHQSQSTRSAIVQIMMRALEARDNITEGHVDRLGELMERMGRRLSLPQEVLADLRLFAKFHDIGKVGIPDSILNKPGRLTDEEMAIMKRHSEIGFRIAKASSDLEPVADWILKHHEHWDGHGYPLGLAGESIPLPCRILGVVDAFDAMTNDRPYRKAMPRENALNEIRHCAGVQFDPRLAEEFIRMLNEE